MVLLDQNNVPTFWTLTEAPDLTVTKTYWAAELVRMGVEKRRSLAATRVRTPTVQPVASRNNDYTILVYISYTTLFFIAIKILISYRRTKRNNQILYTKKFKFHRLGFRCDTVSVPQIQQVPIKPKICVPNIHVIFCRNY